MSARLKVPAKNSPALLFLSRGKEEERKTTTISCFSPAEEEQSRGIFGGNFQRRAHDGNKAAGLKDPGWKAVVKPRFYLFSKHFDVLAYLKHVNVSEFPVLFPRPTNEEEEFPGLPPDVGRLVIGHVVAKHPMPIATEKLDSSSTDSSGAVRNLLHLNKIAHF